MIGISPVTYPLSSLRATPDLDLINPRILDPLWPRGGCSLSINRTCPAVCTDNDGPVINSEKLSHDPIIIQPVSHHIDFHEVGPEVSRVTTEKTSEINPAPCPDTDSSGPSTGSGCNYLIARQAAL